MEIHSSSLAYYPATTKRSHSAKSSTTKFVERELNDFKKDKGNRNRSSNTVLTPEHIEKELSQVGSIKEANNNLNPVNVHTQKALSAYNETVNQPLNEHRTQLTSIDFYV